MRDLTAAVVDAVHMAGFVEIEVSAKHVHLTQEDVEVLFGKGAKLEPKRRYPSLASSSPSSA